MTTSDRTARFSARASEARGRTPGGISPAEGWWLVALAVVLGTSHAVLYQSHALPWGGIVRFAALLVTIVALPWLASRVAFSRRVRPHGHGTRLAAAGVWAFLVVLVAGWLWVVPPEGHDVGWPWTTTTAAVGVLPLALVGLHLVRTARR